MSEDWHGALSLTVECWGIYAAVLATMGILASVLLGVGWLIQRGV